MKTTSPARSGARMPPAILFENVAKSFDNVTVIEGVNLRIRQGSCTVVVGPSGCGKSTLLNLAAGLETPSTGVAIVHGREVAGPTPDTALLFQSYNLFPWMTALDNVAFGLRNHGASQKAARDEAMRLLETVGLGACAGKTPQELSGGMKQRVALVRAFALKPKLLLMDEPFAALDHQTRRIMQAYLLSVWDQSGCTVILVTHDLDEALFLADQLILFSGSPGRVVEAIDIDAPRPRSADDPGLMGIHRRLEAHLEAEAAHGEFTEAELETVRPYMA